MRDIEKQIEEIAKEERVAELRLFHNYCKYNGCEEKTANDCDNCYFNKVYTKLAILENKIRNGTLKELTEDSVVLSREEYDTLLLEQKRLKEIVNRIPCGYELKEKASKETAEKIKGFIFSKLNEATDDLTRLILRELYWQVDGFAKQLDVEIKE